MRRRHRLIPARSSTPPSHLARQALHALPGLTVPAIIAAGTGLLILIPGIWMQRAVGSDPNLARVLGQLINPVELALQAAPSYGPPIAIATILTGFAGLTIWIYRHRAHPQRLTRRDGLIATLALILTAAIGHGFVNGETTLYLASLAIGAGLLGMSAALRADTIRYRTLVVGAIPMAFGLVAFTSYTPFPHVTLDQEDATHEGHLITYTPSEGAWLITTLENDSQHRGIIFIPAETITHINYQP